MFCIAAAAGQTAPPPRLSKKAPCGLCRRAHHVDLLRSRSGYGFASSTGRGTSPRCRFLPPNRALSLPWRRLHSRRRYARAAGLDLIGERLPARLFEGVDHIEHAVADARAEIIDVHARFLAALDEGEMFGRAVNGRRRREDELFDSRALRGCCRSIRWVFARSRPPL